MAIVSSKSFVVVNAKTRAAKGPLVRVELQPGRFVKMYRADAEAQGLIAKSQPAAEDKSREPGENKGTTRPSPPATPPSQPETGTPDDFTAITGVGKATARALAAAGITTFEQLRTADLSRVVSAQVAEAIEAWRSSDG